MYVSYDYYSTTFGGSIPEADFSAAEAKAEAYISYLTYVNGDVFAAEDDRVKRAVCVAADVIYSSEQTSASSGTAGIKSESNDGYSVTYVTEAQDGQTAEAALRMKVAEAVRIYLLPTGWLSRKVQIGGCRDVCECCDNRL